MENSLVFELVISMRRRDHIAIMIMNHSETEKKIVGPACNSYLVHGVFEFVLGSKFERNLRSSDQKTHYFLSIC